MRKFTPNPSVSQAPAILEGSTAVIIGRWQLFHKGHETLLNTALAVAAQVIVVIGSSLRARDSSNPFTWEERQAMVQAGLSASDLPRVKFLPVRDYFDDDRWNAAIANGVKELTASLSASSGPITLVGFKRDRTSFRLDSSLAWPRLEVPHEVDIEATALRNVFFEGTDPDARLAVLAPFVSKPVLGYLQAWARLPAYTELVREYLAVANYRKRWAPNCYLTADAVVVVARHLLLVRRKGDIGHGLWALPGGFVEPNERLYSAAVRELMEETGFKVLASTMRAALQGSEVFDDPKRSPRGRLVTNAFYFNFGEMRLPEVKGADDAMDAKWVPVEELAQYENKLFEDHAAIVDRFVGVYR
ncbi:MAG: NUDIX domain-containing protein [Rhodoferax sp.]